MSNCTFTVYSSTPFDISGALVAPYLAIARLATWSELRGLLIGKRVAISTGGLVLRPSDLKGGAA